MVSSIFTREDAALAASNLITLPAIMFGGFYANSSTVPKWLSWLEYLSPVFYSFSALTHA
jgi:ABC-type multidrug transport system permease subunit